MDYAGVDMALIHTNPMLTRDSAYLSDCVHQYPNRLRSMAPADEWRIIDEADAVIEELSTAITQHRLHAIKFNTRPAFLKSSEPWDDGPYRPFWQATTALSIPIFFTLGTGPSPVGRARSAEEQRRGYLDEQQVLLRWMDRYPDSICSLTHGFPWRAFLEEDRFTLPEAVWDPFGNPNCHLEICFPVRVGDLFDFPFREVWPALEISVERIGADRLLWGTDMPFQNRFCTYRQSRDWIEKYCTFLNRTDLQMVMGGTASRLLGLGDSDPTEL